jgi:guanidinopropionase
MTHTVTMQPIDSFKFPRFSQPATFFRTPWVQDMVGVDIGLVGVPFDLNTNRNGARQGPAQIREMSRLIRRFPAYDTDSPFDLVNIADIGDAPVNPLIPEEAISQIVSFFAEIKSRGITPLAAGGDHGITYPIWKGLLSPKEPVGVIHFDSHPDTNDEIYGNRFNHGTLFTRAIEEGLVDPKRVISVGIHGTRFARDDRAFNRDHGMTVLTMDDVDELGRKGVIERIRDVVGQGPTYLTLDIDGIDPADCPGTAAPEPGGLRVRDAQVIIRGLAGINFIGADVNEVSPPLDQSGITALNAANLLFEILCVMAPVVHKRLA